jgi:hypothetical protein
MNPNILKLLAFLGGGASQGYGNFQKVGGQPLLPKPGISQSNLLSPYAPGNLQGQTMTPPKPSFNAGKQAGGVIPNIGGMQGGVQVSDSSGPHIQPNSTNGVKPPAMHESANHAVNQLAQYVAHYGNQPMPRGQRPGGPRDGAAFIRGGHALQ